MPIKNIFKRNNKGSVSPSKTITNERLSMTMTPNKRLLQMSSKLNEIFIKKDKKTKEKNSNIEEIIKILEQELSNISENDYKLRALENNMNNVKSESKGEEEAIDILIKNITKKIEYFEAIVNSNNDDIKDVQ